MPEKLSNIHSDAVAAHRAGDLKVAEKGYRALLSANPDAAEIHYLLGVVLAQSQRHDEAVETLLTCLHYQSGHAPALNLIGSVFAKLGRVEDAIDALAKAASVAPDDPKILFNLAKASIDGKRFDLGADALVKLLEISPHHIEAIIGYATCLSKLGQADKAIETLKKGISAAPAAPELFEYLSRLLIEQKNYGAALIYIDDARAQWPDNSTLLLARATALQLLGRNEESTEAYKALISTEPKNAYFLNKFSGFLHDIGQWEEAETYSKRSLEIEPESVSALTNMGRIRQQRGDLTGAKILYEKAIHIDPSYADAHNNLGNLFLYMAQIKSALIHLDEAIKLKPESSGFRFNRSVTVFTSGAINSAWRDHRGRFERDKSHKHTQWPWPQWDGEALDGRRILLWGEQGLGDQIIHARAASTIAANAEHCALECSTRLSNLFKRSFPEIEIWPANAPPSHDLSAQPFDFHCSSLDMNCSLYDSEADISSTPYLKADPDLTKSIRKKYRSAHGERPLIGISWWSGYSHHAHFKSIALSRWTSILSNPDAAFVSLQYGEGRSEIAPIIAEKDLELIQDIDVDPMGDMDIFAAQVSAMDLVISISNTTAHMAGALGVPVWNLTPTGPARLWYWFLEGEASPWYDTMKVFRHAYDESWDGVLEDVSALLKSTAPKLLSSVSS